MQLEAEQFFIILGEYGDTKYGYGLPDVQTASKQGLISIMEVDVQCALRLAKSGFEFHLIFIEPPSFAELEKRLRDRKTETEEQIQARLQFAMNELSNKDIEAITTCKLINAEFTEFFTKAIDLLRNLYPQISF